MRIWLSSMALVGLAAACGSGAKKQREQEERAALIYALARLDPSAPAKQRAEMIQAVRKIDLTDKEMIATRDVCLDAHQGLLDAHLLQAEARKAFMEAKSDDEHRTSHAAHAQEALDASSKTLASARTSLDACQNHTRTLVRGNAASTTER